MAKKNNPFANLKKGALHKELGVSPDEPIPAKKLNSALNSDNPTERKRAQFAKNFGGKTKKGK